MHGISLIAAIDRHRAIGFDNRLPWSLPADLKRFKALTTGHAILMGRKTAESTGQCATIWCSRARGNPRFPE